VTEQEAALRLWPAAQALVSVAPEPLSPVAVASPAEQLAV